MMLYHNRKLFHLFIQIFLFQITPLYLLGSSGEKPKPSAYFQAILWDSEEAETFTYAPWGNSEDQNASLLSISISSDTLTRRFAYYGTSPLRLYRQKEETGKSSPNTLNGNSLDSDQRELAVEYNFQIGEGHVATAIKEEVLMLRKGNLNKFKVFTLPFSEYKVPKGSFLFQSFANEDTFFRAGKQKFKLPGRGSRLIAPKTGESEKSLEIEGFLLRNQKYQLGMQRKIGAFEKKRGIFIINAKGNTIKPYTLIERYSNYENAFGYGVSPLTNEPTSEDNATNPTQ